MLERSEVITLGWGDVKEEENTQACETTERQVDIEAPSPGDVRRESAADEGAKDRRYTKDSSDEALVHGPLGEGNCVHNDCELK